MRRLAIAALVLAAAPARAEGPPVTGHLDALMTISVGFWQTTVALGAAFVLGTMVGLERQWRQRSAGLRTTVLVAVGAAGFTDLGARLLGDEGASRLIAYVISGIGFLGAGVILKDGANIKGLNTAATLWCAAAIGAFCGSGLPAEAAVLSAFVLAANTALRPVVEAVNRRPLGGMGTEAHYRVHAICDIDAVPDVRDLLTALLEAAHYPVREIETLSETDNRVELAASLVSTEARAGELDEVVAALERSGKVRSATWTVSATQ